MFSSEEKLFNVKLESFNNKLLTLLQQNLPQNDPLSHAAAAAAAAAVTVPTLSTTMNDQSELARNRQQIEGIDSKIKVLKTEIKKLNTAIETKEKRNRRQKGGYCSLPQGGSGRQEDDCHRTSPHDDQGVSPQ